jgi:hypothetical protein
MVKTKERAKRTYNLDPSTIELVRSMVGTVAETQDAVIERSVRAMARRMRDLEHTRLWAQGVEDPEFQREMQEIFTGFESADRDAWSEGA